MAKTKPMVLQKPKPAHVSTSESFDVKIMQLNAWLIPVRPAFPACLDFSAFRRAERMASWLEAEVINRQLDVAIFQEVWTPWRSFVAATFHTMFCCRLFGRHVIESTLAKVLPYFTRVHGSRACDCTKRFFDSGLVIASRFPIVAEDFAIYPSGSPHDAMSSKGVLVAALRRPDDTLLIVASSHLDAGHDDSFKLSQLDIAVDFIQSFISRIQREFSQFKIVGTIFGSDMNIDGIEFWNHENSYAKARARLNAVGMQDTWLLTPRAIPSQEEVEINGGYRPEIFPQLGITSDQHDCVKRLDYIWVSPGPISSQGPCCQAAMEITEEAAPAQLSMERDTSISPREIKQFGISAVTELNDGVLWQTLAEYRSQIEAAVTTGDDTVLKRLKSRVDRHDRAERLSDHAALFATVHFFK
jgi:hypothetical protein